MTTRHEGHAGVRCLPQLTPPTHCRALPQEISKLREAVENVANVKRLDSELERLRNALGQRQQDIEQTKARQSHASQLCAEVLAKTAQREQELEVCG